MRAECAQKSLDTSRRAGYNIQVSSSLLACGFSSSGRASASQAEGGEFEPRNPLHSQRQDVCSGAFLFWGFTMLPPRESVVRPLCRGCFGERVTSSDGCGQNRHEKTTVRRHRGGLSRFKAALFFRRGNFFGRELPEFDRLSFPYVLPFQPGTFTFSGHLTLAAIPLSSGLHSTLHGNAGSVLLLPLPLLTIIRKCTTLRSLPARKYAFGCVAACWADGCKTKNLPANTERNSGAGNVT